MPKIIESVREQLLATAKKQIETNGYAKTTVRSVAAECGIAVGTVYNYFPSKDMLIATFVAEDWQACLRDAENCGTADAEAYLRFICDTLTAFAARHAKLFSDPDAARTYAEVFSERHGQLRDRLADLIRPLCTEAEEPFLSAQFIAEALLTWTMAGIPFERIYTVIRRTIGR